jgi:NADH:ubiquinone oxidoreductase subunit 3 (subunit A)
MMPRLSSGARYLLIGVTLMIFSVILAFLMTIGVITPSFALSFFVFAASFGGVLLGIIGVAYYAQLPRRRR